MTFLHLSFVVGNNLRQLICCLCPESTCGWLSVQPSARSHVWPSCSDPYTAEEGHLSGTAIYVDLLLEPAARAGTCPRIVARCCFSGLEVTLVWWELCADGVKDGVLGWVLDLLVHCWNGKEVTHSHHEDTLTMVTPSAILIYRFYLGSFTFQNGYAPGSHGYQPVSQEWQFMEFERLANLSKPWFSMKWNFKMELFVTYEHVTEHLGFVTGYLLHHLISSLQWPSDIVLIDCFHLSEKECREGDCLLPEFRQWSCSKWQIQGLRPGVSHTFAQACSFRRSIKKRGVLKVDLGSSEGKSLRRERFLL